MSLVISKVFTYDTDAGNYIQAVEAADQADTPGIGALEPATRQAINNFVIGCKQDGIWNAIKVGCILAGAKTLEGSFIDLKSATKLLTNNNFADGTYVGSNYTTGDYNRKTGLVGNGSSKYLNSNRNNNADPQDSNHNAAYATNIGTAGAFMGANDSSSGVGIGTNFISRSGFTRNRNPAGTASPAAIAPGLFAMSRSTSGSYIVRVAQINGTVNSISEVPFTSNVHVFQRPGDSTIISIPTDARLAFYSIGEAIDLARLDSRVTDLINAFGAAIP